MQHIYEKDVDKFSETVFGSLNPNYVIITTPNSDFNIWFGDEVKHKYIQLYMQKKIQLSSISQHTQQKQLQILKSSKVCGTKITNLNGHTMNSRSIATRLWTNTAIMIYLTLQEWV